MRDNNSPAWMENGKVDEAQFCRQFLMENPMVYVDGAFFNEEGRIPDEQAIRKRIYDEINPYLYSGISRKVDSIFAVLKMEARRDSLPFSQTKIHVANGTYDLVDGFTEYKYICRYRLPVFYRSCWKEPENWLKFVHELLEPQDVDTLQEYMGYCLIPTTAAQKMLIITGRGGEGKSRIGVVMKALLGNNMSVGSIAKIETNPFARADLEHLLLLVDDDLKLEALSQTNNLKTIITAELPMDLEKKGLQSYQGKLYARLLAFGNGTLQSMNDRSYGFFRRQIILTAKPVPKDRVNDPYLGQKLTGEADSIFMWAVAGLYRLIGQDMRFTVSRAAQENLKQAMADANNILDFLTSEGYFRFDCDGSATSRQLYRVYRDWCDDNMVIPMSSAAFWTGFRQCAPEYRLTYSNNIPIGHNKTARGFRGIRVLPRT